MFFMYPLGLHTGSEMSGMRFHTDATTALTTMHCIPFLIRIPITAFDVCDIRDV